MAHRKGPIPELPLLALHEHRNHPAPRGPISLVRRLLADNVRLRTTAADCALEDSLWQLLGTFLLDVLRHAEAPILQKLLQGGGGEQHSMSFVFVY